MRHLSSSSFTGSWKYFSHLDIFIKTEVTSQNIDNSCELLLLHTARGRCWTQFTAPVLLTQEEENLADFQNKMTGADSASGLTLSEMFSHTVIGCCCSRGGEGRGGRKRGEGGGSVLKAGDV